MIKKIVIHLIILFTLLGCGTGIIKEFVDTPQVKGIELKSFSIQNKRATFEVALYNPNAFSLPISGLSGNIKLNQRAIGKIDADTDQQLAAHATQTFTLPIMLNPDILINAAKSMITQGQAKYSFNGNIKTSVGQIPFSKKGSLSMNDLISEVFR